MMFRPQGFRGHATFHPHFPCNPTFDLSRKIRSSVANDHMCNSLHNKSIVDKMRMIGSARPCNIAILQMRSLSDFFGISPVKSNGSSEPKLSNLEWTLHRLTRVLMDAHFVQYFVQKNQFKCFII